MVKHVVSFKFSGTAEERADASRRFKEALEKLPFEIDVLLNIEVGINENPNESWDLVLMAMVPNMEDLPLYAQHPAHVAALGLVKPQIEARACVDYIA